MIFMSTNHEFVQQISLSEIFKSNIFSYKIVTCSWRCSTDSGAFRRLIACLSRLTRCASRTWQYDFQYDFEADLFYDYDHTPKLTNLYHTTRSHLKNSPYGHLAFVMTHVGFFMVLHTPFRSPAPCTLHPAPCTPRPTAF